MTSSYLIALIEYCDLLTTSRAKWVAKSSYLIALIEYCDLITIIYCSILIIFLSNCTHRVLRL